jgi:RNase P subunit RPR2
METVGKKPVYNCIRGALCPVCDGELYPKFIYVRRFKHEEIRIEEKTPFCKHCGHALYWGKESEVAKRREDIEKSPVDCLTPSVTDSKGDTE